MPNQPRESPTTSAADPLPMVVDPSKQTTPTSREPQRTPPKPASDSPKIRHSGLSMSTSNLRLTGAAAMAEMKRHNQDPQSRLDMSNRQTSPNPAVEAVRSLVSGGGMSRASDAPAPVKLSSPLRQAAEKIVIPSESARAQSDNGSAVSVGSFRSLESIVPNNALTATAHSTSVPRPQYTGESSQMTDEPSTLDDARDRSRPADQDGNKAFSYPGRPGEVQSEQQSSDGALRGMSHPGYGQSSPRSPASTKRHKCPHCDVDFTRHHNLKSHLLTHSQEKPFVCPDCSSSFRRLHDLKRHSKLHTGERPHTCKTCGRRFARGDALARHNKGPGPCAGRRSSFGGDGDGTADSMDGVEYTSPADDYDGADDHARRVSEPSRKRQQVETSEDLHREVYRQHSSTYPPPPTRTMRESVGSMAPPSVALPSPSSVAPSREGPNHPGPLNGSSTNQSYYSQGQVFQEPGMMTQSPKPLSPGGLPESSHRPSIGDASTAGSLGRNRSTSLTTQFQQQQFGRGSSVGKTSPRMASQYPPIQPGGATTMLPPLGASALPQPRGASQAPSNSQQQHSHQPQHLHPHTGGGLGSNAGSLSSHGRSSGSSIREVLGSETADVWQYVRQIEARFERKQNEYELRIQNLQEEVKLIRAQLSGNAPGYGGGGGPEMGTGGRY
jgi:hypothetical protein